MGQRQSPAVVVLAVCLCAGLVPGAFSEEVPSHSSAAEQVPVEQVTVAALEKISRQLNQPSRLRGGFRQTKTLPNLPRPLQSRGQVALSREQGISWRTLQPVASHIVMGGDGESQSSSAFSRQMAEPMMHILRGDFVALEQMFYVDAGYATDASGSEGNWKMSLRPRSTRLQKYLNAIEIFGTDSVHRIRLLEGNQSVTEIEFFNMQPVAAQDAQFLAEFVAD